MSRVHTSRFLVEFGDCDPAGIVFYPNFLRWMDAAALHFFRAAGVDSVPLSTDAPYERALVRFFKERERRRSAGR